MRPMTPPEIDSDDLDEPGTVAHWHFAVGGLQTQQARIEANQAIALRRLKSFPGPDELVASLDDLTTAGIMAHHGEAVIQHELVIEAASFGDALEEIVQAAGLVMAALRIRTGADVFCPAVCERSWGDLPGEAGQRYRAYRVEQVTLAHKFDRPYLVDAADLEWVATNLGPLYNLSQDVRVATAVEALGAYLHAANTRMMAAQLWAGIEALFDVQYEISYRLGLLIALLLERPGPECRNLFRRVKKLYHERSRALHGSQVSEEALAEHVNQVRTLLAQLLAGALRRGRLPTKDELDDIPFLPSES